MRLSETDWKQIPILSMDIEGFSLRNTPEQRTILTRLQELCTDAAKFFMPFGNVWGKWRRHGTGDGYYFLFDALPPQVAYKYSLEIKEKLESYNRTHGPDLPIRLRMVLALGDVELVGDQYLSDTFTESERFLSHEPFKQLLQTTHAAAVLAMTALFHTEWQKDPSSSDPALAVPDLQWSRLSFQDKHGLPHEGYVLGKELVLEAAAREPKRLRILILVGHFIRQPLPEASVMAKRAALNWKDSGLCVELRLDKANIANLKKEASRGFDVFIFYGHGDDQGRLLFEEGPRDLGQMDLGDFWKKVTLAVVFACQGHTFAQGLPCPWIAFSGNIWQTAPAGFLHECIRNLKQEAVCDAVQSALATCRQSMESSFPDLMKVSENPPLPDIFLERCAPDITRLSPAVSGSFEFAGAVSGKIPYAEHDPFVGRAEDLENLMRFKEPSADGGIQRVVWVWGDAGMGKTSLLRQFAEYVRDCAFHEKDEPVHLFRMNCWDYVDRSKLEEALARALSRFYFPSGESEPLERLVKKLENMPGSRHVWILDDLSYLSRRPDDSEEAKALVARIEEAARQSCVNLQLVVSTRRPGPMKRERIPVGPLAPVDARNLAVCARKRAQPDIPDEELSQDIKLGADRIFRHVRGLTALYKRALLLAVEQGISFAEYANRMESRGDLERMGAEELAEKLTQLDAAQLSLLETKHGFAYGRFLGGYFALINRAGWFSEDELRNWFGETLHANPEVPISQAYENGMRTLLYLNFVATGQKPGQDAVFIMPPNQRLPMRSLSRNDTPLPEAIPLRGPGERLSLAMEQLGRGDVRAIQDVFEMVSDYASEVHKPEAAAAVFFAKNVMAELKGRFANQPEEQIKIYDELIGMFDYYKDGYGAGDIGLIGEVAQAFVNKGAALGELKRRKEEIAVYDDLLARFGDRMETPIAEMAAKALINKAITLGELERWEEEVAVYNNLLARFGDRMETPIAEEVAKALVNKAVTLGKLDRLEEEIAVYDDLLARFGQRTETPIAEEVAKALVNKAATLRILERKEEAIVACEELLARYGNRTAPPFAELVATALANEVFALNGLERWEEAIAVCDDLLARFGERTETPIAEQMAGALLDKMAALDTLSRWEEVRQCFASLTNLLKHHQSPLLEKISQLTGQIQEFLQQAQKGEEEAPGA
ncbi:MAG: AAA family ATPase [Thermodesulfobacteriota bacterium]